MRVGDICRVRQSGSLVRLRRVYTNGLSVVSLPSGERFRIAGSRLEKASPLVEGYSDFFLEEQIYNLRGIYMEWAECIRIEKPRSAIEQLAVIFALVILKSHSMGQEPEQVVSISHPHLAPYWSLSWAEGPSRWVEHDLGGAGLVIPSVIIQSKYLKVTQAKTAVGTELRFEVCR